MKQSSFLAASCFLNPFDALQFFTRRTCDESNMESRSLPVRAALPVRRGARKRAMAGNHTANPCRSRAPGPSGADRRTARLPLCRSCLRSREEQDGGRTDARESRGYGGSVQEAALHCSPTLTGPSLISSLG